MTRKDFILLASNIRYIADENTRRIAATAVASACLKSNPRFDTDKFMKACGV